MARRVVFTRHNVPATSVSYLFLPRTETKTTVEKKSFKDCAGIVVKYTFKTFLDMLR